MCRYFYLLHLLKPNQLSLQIPIYVEAETLETAKDRCKAVKERLTKQFELLLDPSEPRRVGESTNAKPLQTFFSDLSQARTVEVEFIPNLEFRIFQNNTGDPTQIIDCRVLMGDGKAERQAYVA